MRVVSMAGPTMGCRAFVLGFVLLLALLLVRGQVLADKQPGKHDHNAAQGTTAGDHGHHQHDRWEPPPAAYKSARSSRWDDRTAIARGEPLFQTYCMICHGTDGRGTG